MFNCIKQMDTVSAYYLRSAYPIKLAFQIVLIAIRYIHKYFITGNFMETNIYTDVCLGGVCGSGVTWGFQKGVGIMKIMVSEDYRKFTFLRSGYLHLRVV